MWFYHLVKYLSPLASLGGLIIKVNTTKFFVITISYANLRYVISLLVVWSTENLPHSSKHFSLRGFIIDTLLLFLLGINWTIDYPACSGSKQSPVNINSDTAVYAEYNNFATSLGYKIVQKGILENDGHTCKTNILVNGILSQ